MKVQVGYLYHIKDEFFKRINDKGLMINHEDGHSRPSYLAIEDDGILWFIPLSSRVEKYKSIIENKTRKYGKCSTILIKNIAGRKQVLLIQNAFPILEKYVEGIHTIGGRYVKISSAGKKEILHNFEYVLLLKERGNNLFFTDIDKIKKIMLKELENEGKLIQV